MLNTQGEPRDGLGVFVVALTTGSGFIGSPEKWFVVAALAGFLLSVIFALVELRVDEKRFFIVAKEYEKPKPRDWKQYEKWDRWHDRLRKVPYVTICAGIGGTALYLASKLSLW